MQTLGSVASVACQSAVMYCNCWSLCVTLPFGMSVCRVSRAASSLSVQGRERASAYSSGHSAVVVSCSHSATASGIFTTLQQLIPISWQYSCFGQALLLTWVLIPAALPARSEGQGHHHVQGLGSPLGYVPAPSCLCRVSLFCFLCKVLHPPMRPGHTPRTTCEAFHSKLVLLLVLSLKTVVSGWCQSFSRG